MEKIKSRRSTSQSRKPLPNSQRRIKTRRQTADPSQSSLIEAKKILKEISKIRKLTKQFKKRESSLLATSSIGNEQALRAATPMDVNRQFSQMALNSSIRPSAKEHSGLNSFERPALIKSFTRNDVAQASTIDPHTSMSRENQGPGANSLKIWLGEDIPPIPKKKRKKKRKTEDGPTSSSKKKRAKTTRMIRSPTSALTLSNAPTHIPEPLFTSNSMLSIPEIKSPQLQPQPPMQSNVLPTPLTSLTHYGMGSFARSNPGSTLQSPKVNPPAFTDTNMTNTQQSNNMYMSLQQTSKVQKLKERIDRNRKTMQRKSIDGLEEIKRFRELEEKAARKIQRLIRKYLKKKKQQKILKKPKQPERLEPIKKQKKEEPANLNTKKLENLLKTKIELRKKRLIKKSRRKASPRPSEDSDNKRKSSSRGTKRENAAPQPEKKGKEIGINTDPPCENTEQVKPPQKEQGVDFPNDHVFLKHAKQRKSEIFQHDSIRGILTSRRSKGEGSSKHLEEFTKSEKDNRRKSFRRLATFNVKEGGINGKSPKVSPRGSIKNLVYPNQLTTPQFTQPKELEECEKVQEGLTNTHENYSEETHSVSSIEEIPITFVVGHRGDKIQWNLLFPEDFVQEADEDSIVKIEPKLIQTEMLAFTLGKRDVVAYKPIKFDKMKVNNNKLPKWAHIAALMSNCLTIFSSLSKSAPVFHVVPFPEKPQEELKDEPSSLIDYFVERSRVKSSLTSPMEIDTIHKTLLSIEASYPRCQSEIEALSQISEPAAYSLAQYMENSEGKRVGPAKVINIFSRGMIDECFREIAKLFVLIKGANGKKLSLSRPWLSEITALEWLELTKRFTTYIDPVYGNPTTAGKKCRLEMGRINISKRTDSSKYLQTERLLRTSERNKDALMDNNHNNDLLEFSDSGVQNQERQESSQEISLEHSLNDILEPMKKFDQKKEENISITERVDRGELLIKEQAHIKEAKALLDKAKAYSYSFFKGYFAGSFKQKIGKSWNKVLLGYLEARWLCQSRW